MERCTLQQRIETVRKFKNFLGRREASSRPAIVKLVQKFKLLGQVSDVKNRTRARRAGTSTNIASVAHSMEENPGLSIPCRSLELGISQTTLHRILHKDLCLKAYKVQLT